MFGLISKKRVARVLKEAYLKEPNCGGDFCKLKCGGNYYDRHNAINWIAWKLKFKNKKGNWMKEV